MLTCSNGHHVAAQDTFCTTCGARVAASGAPDSDRTVVRGSGRRRAVWVVAGGLVVALLAVAGGFAFVGLGSEPDSDEVAQNASESSEEVVETVQTALLTEVAKGDWECLIIDGSSKSGYVEYPMDNSTANEHFAVAEEGFSLDFNDDDYQGYEMIPIRVTDDEAEVNWGFQRATYDWSFTEDDGLRLELTSIDGDIDENGQWEPGSLWGSSGGDETPQWVSPDLVDDPAPQDVYLFYEPDGDLEPVWSARPVPMTLSYSDGIAQIDTSGFDEDGNDVWGVCRKDQFLLDRYEEYYRALAEEWGWPQPPSVYPTEE